jgi:predicted phage baseplate assembly protein
VDPSKLGPLDALKVLYGWKDVGTLLPAPLTRVSTSRSALNLATVPPFTYPSASHSKVLVADVNAVGAQAGATVQSGKTTLQLDSPQPVRQELQAPLRVYFRPLTVSRGATVAGEVVGSGDSSIAGQDFTLSKAPVTYLQDPGSRSGPGYSSTVRVWVDGIEWHEVQSFYGQPRDAHVFVTIEDQSGSTHVLFGDGDQGARLTSGTGNVVATYRHGAGGDAPPAGTLTKALRPPQGLVEISNPIGVGGGADAQPADSLRINAPASVLALDRAISADDYEAIAASAPGVTRARSYWAWDSAHQRALVKVYVGDDLQAQAAAQHALDGAIDPNRPVTVQLATPAAVRLSIKIELDPARANPASIRAGVVAALADPVDGLFASRRMRIGQSFYTSQIAAACLSVPGVATVNAIHVHAPIGAGKDPYRPGPGSFFRLAGKAHVY